MGNNGVKGEHAQKLFVTVRERRIILHNAYKFTVTIRDVVKFPHCFEGMRLWESNVVMSRYIILNTSQFKDKSILELASGTGICGITLAKWTKAKNVLLADKYDEIINNIKVNMKNNAVSHPVVIKMSWNEYICFDNQYDVILACDPFFHGCSYESLYNIMLRFLCVDGSLIISVTSNTKIDEFIKIVEEDKFRIDKIQLKDNEYETNPLMNKVEGMQEFKNIIEGKFFVYSFTKTQKDALEEKSIKNKMAIEKLTTQEEKQTVQLPKQEVQQQRVVKVPMQPRVRKSSFVFASKSLQKKQSCNEAAPKKETKNQAENSSVHSVHTIEQKKSVQIKRVNSQKSKGSIYSGSSQVKKQFQSSNNRSYSYEKKKKSDNSSEIKRSVSIRGSRRSSSIRTSSLKKSVKEQKSFDSRLDSQPRSIKKSKRKYSVKKQVKAPRKASQKAPYKKSYQMKNSLQGSFCSRSDSQQHSIKLEKKSKRKSSVKKQVKALRKGSQNAPSQGSYNLKNSMQGSFNNSNSSEVKARKNSVKYVNPYLISKNQGSIIAKSQNSDDSRNFQSSPPAPGGPVQDQNSYQNSLKGSSVYSGKIQHNIYIKKSIGTPLSGGTPRSGVSFNSGPKITSPAGGKKVELSPAISQNSLDYYPGKLQASQKSYGTPTSVKKNKVVVAYSGGSGSFYEGSEVGSVKQGKNINYSQGSYVNKSQASKQFSAKNSAAAAGIKLPYQSSLKNSSGNHSQISAFSGA